MKYLFLAFDPASRKAATRAGFASLLVAPPRLATSAMAASEVVVNNCVSASYRTCLLTILWLVTRAILGFVDIRDVPNRKGNDHMRKWHCDAAA